MKQLFTLMAFASLCHIAKAQQEPAKTDSIRVGNMVIVTNGKTSSSKNNSSASNRSDTAQPGNTADTLRVGNIIIVNSGKRDADNDGGDKQKTYWDYKPKKSSNVSTNWIIVDIGFSNYNDQTNYSNTGGYLYQRTGAAPFGKNDFDLNIGKSININIWLFMQRLNLIKQHVHLKYGLGVELNNYRYKSQVSYLLDNPFVSGQAPAPIIFRDSISFTKNKLAADYISVPVMLSFSSNAKSQKRGLSVGLGVSVGYLYSQRNKQVSAARGRQTNGGGFDLEQFKLSYVGEIGLGPVRLYGSYAPTSFYQRGLDMRPYTLGVRLSNW